MRFVYFSSILFYNQTHQRLEKIKDWIFIRHCDM